MCQWTWTETSTQSISKKVYWVIFCVLQDLSVNKSHFTVSHVCVCVCVCVFVNSAIVHCLSLLLLPVDSIYLQCNTLNTWAGMRINEISWTSSHLTWSNRTLPFRPARIPKPRWAVYNAYTHKHTHTYWHTHIHRWHAHIHWHKHTYIGTHTHTHTHRHIQTPHPPLPHPHPSHLHARTHTYTYTNTHTYTCMQIYIFLEGKHALSIRVVCHDQLIREHWDYEIVTLCLSCPVLSTLSYSDFGHCW